MFCWIFIAARLSQMMQNPFECSKFTELEKILQPRSLHCWPVFKTKPLSFSLHFICCSESNRRDMGITEVEKQFLRWFCVSYQSLNWIRLCEMNRWIGYFQVEHSFMCFRLSIRVCSSRNRYRFKKKKLFLATWNLLFEVFCNHLIVMYG